MNEIIRSIESAQLRTDIPKFNVGDTVRVFVKVVEGTRERLQAFEGVVIARRNGSVRETFTVRRTSYGVGVERTFPVHSPRVDHIVVVRRGKVRRAKLYYLKESTGIPGTWPAPAGFCRSNCGRWMRWWNCVTPGRPWPPVTRI